MSVVDLNMDACKCLFFISKILDHRGLRINSHHLHLCRHLQTRGGEYHPHVVNDQLTNADREKYSLLSTLFGIFVALDYLEHAYVRGAITAAESVLFSPWFCNELFLPSE
jgi:hypothetical protein